VPAGISEIARYGQSAAWYQSELRCAFRSQESVCVNLDPLADLIQVLLLGSILAAAKASGAIQPSRVPVAEDACRLRPSDTP